MQDDIEKGAAPEAEKLTVREFLGKFGYARRGSWIVGHIRNTMEEFNLRTQPDFEYAYIDSEISIRLNSEVADAQSQEEFSRSHSPNRYSTRSEQEATLWLHKNRAFSSSERPIVTCGAL